MTDVLPVPRPGRGMVALTVSGSDGVWASVEAPAADLAGEDYAAVMGAILGRLDEKLRELRAERAERAPSTLPMFGVPGTI